MDEGKVREGVGGFLQSTSYPVSDSILASYNREYIYPNITLTGNKTRSEICGKLTIQRYNLLSGLEDEQERLRSQYREEIPYKALVIELQGFVTVSNSEGEKTTQKLKQLSPEADTELICNSNIFAVNGSMKGLKKGDVSQAQTFFNPPPSSNFKLQLTQIHEPLPSNFETSHVSVNYILVLYIRTEQDYVELTRRPFTQFRGHSLISAQNSNCTISREVVTKSAKLTLTSPQKYYILNEPINFTIAVEANYKLSRGVHILMSLVQVICMKGCQDFETVLDNKTFNCTKEKSAHSFCGKLLGKKKLKSTPDSIPVMISYNDGQDDGFTVQHFLKGEFTIVEEGSRHYLEEEIFIGTGRTLSTKVDSTSSFLSRMRSQSISSLLSLFPPSYSNLSSRRGSLASLQTLPPHYDDVSQGSSYVECTNCHKVECRCSSAPC